MKLTQRVGCSHGSCSSRTKNVCKRVDDEVRLSGTWMYFCTQLVQFIYSMLAGVTYPKDFRRLPCHRFSEWFQLGSHCLPSPSSHSHQPAITCSIRVPAKLLHNHGQPVSLLNSLPLDRHNARFPTSVMPASQGPTCHSWNRGCPSWEQGQQPQLAQNEGWFRQSQ